MKTVEELQVQFQRETTITAVDIGEDGSIFSVECLFEEYNSIKLKDMPPTWDMRAREICAFSPRVIYAEDVHTMPMQGVVSNGSLMEQKGFLIGVCAAREITLQLVTPIKWIECFTVKRTSSFVKPNGKKDARKWKQHLADIAKELVPDSLVNEITYKNADSVLIWVWAAHMELGIPLEKKKTQLTFNI